MTAHAGDYTTTQVTEGSSLYFTNARAVTALTGQNISLFTNNVGYLTVAASSSLLCDNNTFSGNDNFSNAVSNFGGTWQTFSPSHFQTALTLPLPIVSGGTATTTQVTNGENYFDWTEITSGS